MPVVMKILDNIIFELVALGLEHCIHKLAPHRLRLARQMDFPQRCNPCDHRHGDLPDFNHAGILAPLLTQRRDGHHKKPLFRDGGTSCAGRWPGQPSRGQEIIRLSLVLKASETAGIHARARIP